MRSTLPPLASTRLRTMDNPSPCPPVFRLRDVSSRTYGSNTNSSFSSGMPGPLSRKSMYSTPCLRSLFRGGPQCRRNPHSAARCPRHFQRRSATGSSLKARRPCSRSALPAPQCPACPPPELPAAASPQSAAGRLQMLRALRKNVIVRFSVSVKSSTSAHSFSRRSSCATCSSRNRSRVNGVRRSCENDVRKRSRSSNDR